MIHDIPKCESRKVQTLFYADDCVIWNSGNDIKEMSLQIQSYLSKLNEWFASRRLRRSMHQKTTPVLFSLGKNDDNFQLFLGDHELKNDQQYIDT